MKKKNNMKQKFFTDLVTIIMSMILIIQAVSAYTPIDKGATPSPVALDYSPLPQSYYGGMYNAMYYWNNNGSGHTYCQYSGSSINKAYVVNSPQNYYGYYACIQVLQGPSINHRTTQFEIGLNDRILSGKGYQQQSTASHELGHSLGLDDLTSGTAVMNINRNRDIINMNQPDDNEGADYSYHLPN